VVGARVDDERLTMSESDEKPFTVNDRRKFTPEGRVRDEAEAASGPEVPGRAAPDETPAEGPIGAGREGGKEPDGAQASADPREARRSSPAGPVDFSQFLLSLGAQAGALLSGAGGEEGTSAEDALAHAQSIISILEMLEDKTRGRRTPDEDRLLEGLLFELRMAYVQKKRVRVP
jgi:hypothetical protein